MVHPDSCDVVSVRKKLSLFFPDDRGIAAVIADSGKIIHQHLPHAVRIHDKKRQTILPEVSPSSAAFSVIVMRQKRATVDPPQHRLKIHPVHPLVKRPISCGILHIVLLLPVAPGRRQLFLYARKRAIFPHLLSQRLLRLRHSK